MGILEQKLDYLSETKTLIKQAITSKGVNVSDSGKIQVLQSIYRYYTKVNAGKDIWQLMYFM